MKLHNLTLAYVVVAFKTFSARVDELLQTVTWSMNLCIFLHIYLLGMSVFKEPKSISQFSNQQLAHYVLQQCLTKGLQKCNRAVNWIISQFAITEQCCFCPFHPKLDLDCVLVGSEVVNLDITEKGMDGVSSTSSKTTAVIVVKSAVNYF